MRFAPKLIGRRLPSAAALALLLSAIVLWQLTSIGDFRIDDAFITFSYSKNLATGSGPVFSHGLRVEGYSNFLWMSLVAGELTLFPHVDVFLLSRLLNVPFLALLFWATYSLSRRRVPAPWAAAAAVLLAACSDLSVAFLCGLETVAYAALTTAALALYVKQESPAAQRAVVPCLVLAALTRIDGMVPLAIILSFELIQRLRTRTFSLSAYAKWALPGVAVYLVWFGWRWWYYGAILPATYYAKELVPVAVPGRGWDYVIETANTWGIVFALPFIVLSLWRARSFEVALLTLFSAGHLAYVVRVGGDWMPFGRFLLPIAAALIVLFVYGAEAACAWTGRRWARALTTVAALGCAAAFGVFMDRHTVNTQAERDKLRFIASQIPYVNDNYIPSAKLMNFVVRPGERLVTDYGVFAYFTQAAVIDMWGLANMTIARRGTTDGVNPIFGKTCPSCYPELDPDYFHVNVPMIRPRDAFRNHRAVVNAVWQSDTIGRYLDLKRAFVAGRVIDTRTQRGLYFLERRRPGKRFIAHRPDPEIVIDYPFEPGGSDSLGP